MEKSAKDSCILSEKQRSCTKALELCCAFWVSVCVFVGGGDFLITVSSDAHADGSIEMLNVFKVPQAVRERKDVSAASSFERRRVQINFLCCLLGRRKRWGLGQAAQKCNPNSHNVHMLLCYNRKVVCSATNDKIPFVKVTIFLI